MATWKKVLTKTPVALDLGANAQDGYVLTATGDDSTTPAWEEASSTIDNAALLTLLSNLESSGGAGADENITIGQDAGDTIVITGNLTVSGETTTLSTTNLTVEDIKIKLADVETPSVTTANGAGIQVETSGTEAEWPEITWIKGQGGQNGDGSGTQDGLTGWTISNMHTSNQIDLPIAVMEFKSDAGAPTGNSGGIGSFCYNSNDEELYIRVAD
jgi:hypothetical protein